MLKQVGFLLFGGVVACGGDPSQRVVSYETKSEAIINGDSCTEQDWPESVAILPQMHVRSGNQRIDINTVACTGTLIAPDVVLAAGHCVDEALLRQEVAQQGLTLVGVDFYISYKANLTSLASGYSRKLPSDAVRALHFEHHPDYSLEGWGVGPQQLNDISVLFLEEVQTVKPAVVITRDESSQVVEGAEVDIVGWGQQTSSSRPQPGSFGEKHCARSFINEVGEYEMQIGSGTSSSRKCHGDSGGPTFLDVQTEFGNKRRVVGITSHSYDYTDCKKGGVDTRVDVYLDWLEETLVANCDEGTRVWCDVKGIIPPEYYEPKAENPGDGSGGEAGSKVSPSDCSTGGVSALSLLALAATIRRRNRP